MWSCSGHPRARGSIDVGRMQLTKHSRKFDGPLFLLQPRSNFCSSELVAGGLRMTVSLPEDAHVQLSLPKARMVARPSGLHAELTLSDEQSWTALTLELTPQPQDTHIEVHFQGQGGETRIRQVVLLRKSLSM